MTQELILDRKAQDEKNTARLLYFAHGVTFLFTLGLLSIIPVIINYMKRPDAEGTIAYSHHSWMIRSFWWYVVWIAIGWAVLILTLGIGFFIAWPIWGIAWLWKAYRLVKGLIDLDANRAMP